MDGLALQASTVDVRLVTGGRMHRPLFDLKGSELGLDWEKVKRILSRKCFSELQVLTFGLSVYDRRLKMMLKKIWGGARQTSEDVDEFRRSSRLSGRRLTKLQVDEVFTVSSCVEIILGLYPSVLWDNPSEDLRTSIRNKAKGEVRQHLPSFDCLMLLFFVIAGTLFLDDCVSLLPRYIVAGHKW
ncbi:hypothetical protein FPV67DRAFT_1449381 [Lyophyllum atratum]|nr:hypothetical protein FPV67DRAFT_1449381 [Lyophyllum atratum]